MAGTSKFINFILSNRYFATATFGLFGSGLYVTSTDGRRIPRITQSFSKGRILPPYTLGDHEISYCERPKVEKELSGMLSSTFSNEYYIIIGQVGSGKSRIVRKLIGDKIKTTGAKGEGAPIYISAIQGLSLADTLSKAIDFRFDEHISVSHFMDFALGIQKFPERDDHKRLTRALSVLEQAAFRYVEEYDRPVVLVIDGIDFISKYYPNTLRILQEKAKLWADTNIVKTIFICNNEHTEDLLQKDANLWTRAAKPLFIGDMNRKEAIAFLQNASKSCNILNENKTNPVMSEAYMNKVVDTVGGRPCRLLSFVYSWANDIPFKDTLQDLCDKEAFAIKSAANNPEVKTVLLLLKGNQEVTWETLNKKVSKHTIRLLLKLSIIRCQDTEAGEMARFDSELMRDIVCDIIT